MAANRHPGCLAIWRLTLQAMQSGVAMGLAATAGFAAVLAPLLVWQAYQVQAAMGTRPSAEDRKPATEAVSMDPEY